MAHIAELLAAEATQRRDEKRREDAQRVLNAYYNGPMYLEDFEDVRAKVFSKPEKLDRPAILLGVMRKFADSKATVFKEAPRFVVVGPDGEEREDETALIGEIASKGRWYDRLRQANTWEQILGTVHLMPRFVNGALELGVLSPAVMIVFQNEQDPQQADAFAYRVGQMLDTPHVTGVTPELWAFWSAEDHFLFKMGHRGEIEILSDPENEDGENPWGVLPIVKIDKVDPPDDEYWSPPQLGILSIHNAANVQMMALSEGVLHQGFTVTGSRNMPAHLFEHRGPGDHYAVENQREGDTPADMWAVKLDADLDKMQAAIEYMIQQAAVLHNLPPQDFSVEQVAESGFSKMVSRLSLLEEREQDTDKWRHALGELFGIVKAVWEVEEFDIDGQFRDDSELVVDFADVQMAETPTEHVARIKELVNLGWMSPVDALMELNPDLDRDAAEAKMAQIAQDKQTFRAALRAADFGLLEPGGDGGPVA